MTPNIYCLKHDTRQKKCNRKKNHLAILAFSGAGLGISGRGLALGATVVRTGKTAANVVAASGAMVVTTGCAGSNGMGRAVTVNGAIGAVMLAVVSVKFESVGEIGAVAFSSVALVFDNSGIAAASAVVFTEVAFWSIAVGINGANVVNPGAVSFVFVEIKSAFKFAVACSRVIEFG